VSGGLQIVFLGTADFAVPSLRELGHGPDQIVAVVTRPDRPAGRGRRMRAPSVKIAARELGLCVYQPERVSNPEPLQRLRDLSPDVLFVAEFGEILSEQALAIPRLGAVNLHASLLPRYRGAAPIQRALLAGETETGVTVQWMASQVDAGDILLQRATAIGDEEDYGSLRERLAALGAEAAQEAMDLLRRGAAPKVAQDHAEATYAPPIRPEELIVDWQRPAGELVRLVRAFSPRPGARTTHRGQLLKVLAARQGGAEGAGKGTPGRVSELTREGIWVKTGEGRLLVTRVQPSGGRVMAANDYLRGRGLETGEQLGPGQDGSSP